jgi:flagellar hook-basal body complex protein FliE
MKAGGIDSSRIESMLAQLKASAQKPQVDALAQASAQAMQISSASATGKVDFSDVLKASLNQLNQGQVKSEQLGKKFAMGDDSVSLSDVMITGQKASISFQATVQVRNKLVSAYRDIMNMQV